MPRLFREWSEEIAYQACAKCLQDKWQRSDVKAFIEEWTGYSRYELMEEQVNTGGTAFRLKYAVLTELSCVLADMVDGIRHGADPELDPVQVHQRWDGNTGKTREIASLCYRHQLLGHAVKLGIEPLLRARILPTQHASIPERGQTALARQVRRMLNRKRLRITRAVKTDCTHAYASIGYGLVIRLLQEEIPRARWILDVMRVLERAAPGGHLIIGGYLDAWLFNYVFSYVMRYALSLRKSRRGNSVPLVIRAVAFMDDMLLMGRSERDLLEAIKRTGAWAQDRLRLTLRQVTGTVRILSSREEIGRRHLAGARRGCPGIDMGGYTIHRTYTTIRARNVPKIRRAFLRGWEELQRTGTVRRQRARAIICRNSMVKTSDGRRLAEGLHAVPLMRLARRNQHYWGRVETARRKERMRHVVGKFQVRRAAGECYC